MNPWTIHTFQKNCYRAYKSDLHENGFVLVLDQVDFQKNRIVNPWSNQFNSTPKYLYGNDFTYVKLFPEMSYWIWTDKKNQISVSIFDK